MNSRYKAVKTIDRKYYKISSWTQPILSANGTMGGDSFAVSANAERSSHYAWYAMDGVTTSTNSWFSNEIATAGVWYSFYNPNPLKVKQLTFLNYNISNQTYRYCSTSGRVQISDDGVTWTDIKTYTNSTINNGATWSIDLSDNTNYSKYYRIYSDTNYNSYGWIINELTINATQLVEATEQDYDIYEDVEVYKAAKTPGRKYYKLLPWTQPVLTSNGVLGGDSFAVAQSTSYSGTQAWMAFDDDTSSSSVYWHATAGFPQYLIFYNPNPLKVSSLDITPYSNWTLGGNVYCSDDNDTWTLLTSFTVNPSNPTVNIDATSYYYKIEFTSSSYYRPPSQPPSGYFVVVKQVDITATQVIEATEQDYDIYEDVEVYKAILD